MAQEDVTDLSAEVNKNAEQNEAKQNARIQASLDKLDNQTPPMMDDTPVPVIEKRRQAWINSDIEELDKDPSSWKGSFLFGDKGEGDYFLHNIAMVAVDEYGGDMEKISSFVKESVNRRNEQAKEKFGEDTEFVISEEAINETLNAGGYGREAYATGGSMSNTNTWKKTSIEKLRRAYAEGGGMEQQMAGMMEGETHTMPDGTVMPGATHGEYEAEQTSDAEIEASQETDEVMESDYLDYVISESLSPNDEKYLLDALESDPKLSTIFDSVITTASEFSGSGPIDGPGTEISDSIPARLSDGEFVFNAKAAGEIGEDALMSMMKDAEVNADRRQLQAGGYATEEKKKDAKEDPDIIVASTEGKVLGKMIPESLQDEEVKKAMMLQNPRYGLLNS